MTIKDFLNWLAQNCNIQPVQGFNTTGDSQKVTYKGKYKYLQGPFNNIELDDTFIIEFCDYLELGTYPPGIKPINVIPTSLKQIKSTLHRGTRGTSRKHRPKK